MSIYRKNCLNMEDYLYHTIISQVLVLSILALVLAQKK